MKNCITFWPSFCVGSRLLDRSNARNSWLGDSYVSTSEKKQRCTDVLAMFHRYIEKKHRCTDVLAMHCLSYVASIESNKSNHVPISNLCIISTSRKSNHVPMSYLCIIGTSRKSNRVPMS